MGLGFVVVALMGESMLAEVFGPRYGEANDVLVLLAPAGACQYVAVFLGASINAMRIFRVQAWINACSLVVVSALALIAIPAMGLLGAGLAVVVGEGLQLRWHLALLWRSVLRRLRAA